MISKDSNVTKEFVKVLFEKTKSRAFVSRSLAFINTEGNMIKLLNYIKENPDCSKSDIDYELVRITM